jgi:hypothetical protein
MRPLRWLSWAAVAVPLVLLLCHEWFGPDIWYHLYLGGRIARTLDPQPADRLLLQQPEYVNLYWIFQLVVRGAFALGGLVPVSLLFVAVWAAALAVWLRTAGAFRAGATGPWLALAAILVCQVRFEARPEAFSYLFLALQVRWLAAWRMDEAPPKSTLLRFAGLEALWANVHGYFAFGPLLVGLRLVAAAVSGEARPGPRRPPGWAGLWRLLGLTVLASVASPFGLGNWREVAVLWRFFGAMRHQIQEFLPPGERPQIDLWSIRLFWAWWLALAAGGVRLARTAGRREAFALLLAAVGLGLSAQAVRSIPLAVFCGAPLVGAILARRRPERPEAAARIAVIVAGAALSAGIVSGAYARFIRSPAAFGIRESTVGCPVAFADYVRRTGFRGAVFATGSDGSYLEFHCPGLRLYGDSRYVDAPLVEASFRALRRPADFRRLDPGPDFDGALLPIVDSREVVVALLQDPQWELASADPTRAFLAHRPTPAGAAAVVEEPRFYRGGDLTDPRQAIAAIEWVRVLAQVGDRADLLRALRQLAAAPRVPAEIVESALDYGLPRRDGEVLAAARALRPRLLASQPIDAAAVDWQLRQAGP